MTKLKSPIELETAFNQYRLSEVLGEGGAGRVYGGLDSGGSSIAVKVLVGTSTDKRRRFKNEIAFLSRTRHSNIVPVLDHGVATERSVSGPFYVMPRFEGSLRDAIDRKPSPEDAMQMFSRLADGVEAAHLQRVTHRDLKPENVLIGQSIESLAVADFGIASFTEEHLLTLVETQPAARLANFQYAAPEQRLRGGQTGITTDIYSLGLMLNELFTGQVPHGTDYQRVEAVAPEFGFLDLIVATMIRQNPADRPATMAEVKGLIQRYKAEAVSLQKLSALTDVVIPQGEVDDPLAHEPPRLVAAEWDAGTLRLTLDRPVHAGWVQALHNMGSFSAIMGLPPTAFQFNGKEATAGVGDHSAQGAIDHFKNWLPIATRELKASLERKALDEQREREQRLRREREAEERRLEINRGLRI